MIEHKKIILVRKSCPKGMTTWVDTYKVEGNIPEIRKLIYPGKIFDFKKKWRKKGYDVAEVWENQVKGVEIGDVITLKNVAHTIGNVKYPVSTNRAEVVAILKGIPIKLT